MITLENGVTVATMMREVTIRLRTTYVPTVTTNNEYDVLQPIELLHSPNETKGIQGKHQGH